MAVSTASDFNSNAATACWGQRERRTGLTQPSGQTEVNELDPGARLVDTHDVLGLEVQVDDALLVDVLHALGDLPHVLDALPLRQLEVLVDDALEQLTPRHAAGADGAVRPRAAPGTGMLGTSAASGVPGRDPVTLVAAFPCVRRAQASRFPAWGTVPAPTKLLGDSGVSVSHKGWKLKIILTGTGKYVQ